MKTIIILGDVIFLPVIRYYIADQQNVLIITLKKGPLQTIGDAETLYCKDLYYTGVFQKHPT